VSYIDLIIEKEIPQLIFDLFEKISFYSIKELAVLINLVHNICLKENGLELVEKCGILEKILRLFETPSYCIAFLQEKHS
jgi:hypothetical protein